MALTMPRRHAQFYVTLAFGVAATAVSAPLRLSDRLLVGADLFFVLYLIWTWHWARKLSGAALRRHFDDADEGVAVIVALALGVVCVSFYAIFDTLGGMHGTAASGTGSVLRPTLALVSVPLGWVLVHTVMAFHYTRLYYERVTGPEGEVGDAGGLNFCGERFEPGPWDFLYYSFTLGMTAQTSDTGVTTTRMRKATLAHSVLSFFYNTVIVALAVNVGLALGQ